MCARVVSQGCFEAMDRRIADVQYSQYYAENLLPNSSSRAPATSPLFVVHDSSSSMYISGASYGSRKLSSF